MESITIKNQAYKFREETYKLSPNDSFSISCAKFDFEGNFTNETLLKSIKGKINNEEFNFETLNKDLNINHWLQTKDNIKIINECSLKINNKRFFNVVEELDGAAAPSNSSTILNSIINEHFKIDISQLLETCIINSDNKQINFEYIPIYYYNGHIKRCNTPLLAEFNIVINILINKFPSFKNQLLTLGKIEMENNLLTNKSMEEDLRIKNKELLNRIKELEEILSNKEVELSDTKRLLLEVREQRELILQEKEEAKVRYETTIANLNKQNEEAERRHKETMEQLRKESEENEQRFIMQITKMDVETAKIVNSVKNTVKLNTDSKISVTPKEPQKEVLRLFINRSDLSNEDTITIKINRCQHKYLKKLESEELQLGKLLETPNAISTLNKFIETSSIEITRLSSNKLEINIDQLELFQSEFKKFVIESQQLNELKIIPEEVNNEVNYNLLKYENLINNLYYLEGSYRSLQYNIQEDRLYYTIKSTNRVVQITNIQNLLQGKLVKINGVTKRRINTIRLINDIYQITYRD